MPNIAPTMAFVFVLGGATAALAEGPPGKVHPWVRDRLASGPAEVLIVLAEQADLRRASALETKDEKGRYVSETLRRTAEAAQRPILDLLRSRGVEHRAFWVANVIWAKADSATVDLLAAREDVAGLQANPVVRMSLPAPAAVSPAAPAAPEWNLNWVNAPAVWALGYRGQGVVVSGGDTGYQWQHPALQGKYRGYAGPNTDHNYHWRDAIHSGGGSCGANSQQPCDDNGHGTHTMGTMVGDDGGTNQVGMAPDARWIACRNMDQGDGTPATYIECFQFFIAPTDLSGGNPNPAMAPHVINNSWSCPPSEGCTDVNVMRTVVESVRAAGIVPVVSAGNSGPACETVNTPAAIYDASFSVGATGPQTDAIASYSSRGPVTADGSARLKPDISAPGSSVRSSYPTGTYATLSGTSMAGPHVAGLVALLISAQPSLAGRVDMLERIICRSAVRLASSTQTCGGIPTGQSPNNVYGHGRIDALAVVNAGRDWIFLDGLDGTCGR
jgi:subtilisin family serine protease